MKNRNLIAASAMIVAATSWQATAQDRADSTNPDAIPERTIVFSNLDGEHPKELIAVFYSPEELHFQDPGAPRFLFLDSKGKLALGIGGYIKGQMTYDFDGSIDGSGFVTNEIAVPSDPTKRNRFGGDASHSQIFLRLVGDTPLGYLVGYVQTEFSNGDNYGMRVKQAYISLGNVTAGLARSTMVDAAAQPPTIDPQGPSGETTSRNLLLRYSRKWDNGFSGAIAIEKPQATYTTNSSVKAIDQRCPDIPINLQYAWNEGRSHVRLSCIVRNLSYRNLVKQSNEFKTGWGAQMTGLWRITPKLTQYNQITYGKGIAEYINDTSGENLDLIPATTNGEMKAPAVLGTLSGWKYQFNDRFMASATFSYSRMYGNEIMSENGYSEGKYIVANGFYNILPDMSVGLEYCWGKRIDNGGRSGHANRLTAAVQYNF